MVDAGWFTDPESPTQLRWWDGQHWTEHRHDAVQTPAMQTPAVQTPDVQTPADVAPAVAEPVWTPPIAIYPAPTPLATAYPPPTATEPAPAATPATVQSVTPTGSATSASYWQTSDPKPHSSRNLLLAVLIPVGTLILILIVFIAVNITEPSTGIPASATARTTDPADTADVIAEFGTPGAPSGMTPVTTLASTHTTAGAALATVGTGFPETFLSNADCKGLSYLAPVTAADKDSTDKMLVLPSYSTGGATPDLTVTAIVREFPDAAKANATRAAMNNLFNECQSGYTNSLGKVQVIGESAGFGDTTNVAWEEYPPAAHLPVGSPSGGVHYETVNYFSESSMVQITCNYNNFTSANVLLCLNWLSEISSQYDRLH